MGHQHIGYVGETEDENRYRGYCAFLKEKQLPFDSTYVAHVPLTSSGGYDGTMTLLRQQPSLTAIFCGDDITAIGVLRAINDFGLKVPDDLSVISIDNSDIAGHCDVPLTSADNPIRNMARIAALQMLDMINGNEVPQSTELEAEIITRDSVAILNLSGLKI